MSDFKFKQCLVCKEHSMLWSNRKVCCPCRSAELLSPEYRAKANAWSAVSRAVQNGRLIPQPCEVCGAIKSEAHHDDYSQPLSVRWLCRAHHRQFHKENAA